MSEPELSAENISSLIDQVLKSKDPATVGLRRILKQKRETGVDFPFRQLEVPTFSEGEGERRILSEDEEHTLELEKEVATLRRDLATQRKKAENAIQAAYRSGVSEGAKRGEEKARAAAADEYGRRVSATEERVAEILAAAEESRRLMILQVQSTLLHLVQALVRKVINAELSVNPDIIVEVIRKTLSYVADRDAITVRVSPDDMEIVTGKKAFWTSVSERLENVRIEPDQRIERGGCIVESASGVADARRELVLSELVEVMERTWEEMVAPAGSAQTAVPARTSGKARLPGEGE